MPPDRKSHYTRKEVSKLLGKSGSEVRRLVNTGELSIEFVDGRYLIPADPVYELLGYAPSAGNEVSITSENPENSAVSNTPSIPQEAPGGEEGTVHEGPTLHPAGHNPFVDHLNSYVTVSPEHASAFDEFSLGTKAPPGGKLRISTPVERFLRERFQGSSPPSIILTGNAGDGKTYLCRQIIEFFSGKPVTDWKDETHWSVSRDEMSLQVVKDLSEVGEEEGRRLLLELQESYQAQTPRSAFLIAANEGRLRALLRREELAILADRVDLQLRGSSANGDERLVVINLNKVSTSAYVRQALDWLTKPAQWVECQGCPALTACPIRFNAAQLADEHVERRLTLLYEMLEHTNVHVTVRDMLIHLAYVVTGGLSCKEVVTEHHDPGHALHRRAYYENCWGTNASPADLRKIAVLHNLQRSDVGDYSFYEVDDFIINGAASEDEKIRAEYEQLFAPAVDLKGEYFKQRRVAYVRGSLAGSGTDGADELLGMLPHCRRKLFFEWNNVDVANRLTPFIFLPDYLELLKGHGGRLEKAKERLVVGLNRALTGLFVTEKNVLYVTSQYAHAVEHPVPIVRVKIPSLNVGLLAEPEGPDWADSGRRRLLLKILHPWSGKPPITEHLDLLRFEYLMRLSRGGTYNVLSEECALFIRELKDKLLTTFGTEAAQEEDRIEFFGVEDDQYVLKTLYMDERGTLRI